MLIFLSSNLSRLIIKLKVVIKLNILYDVILYISSIFFIISKLDIAWKIILKKYIIDYFIIIYKSCLRDILKNTVNLKTKNLKINRFNNNNIKARK